MRKERERERENLICIRQFGISVWMLMVNDIISEIFEGRP